MYAYNSYKKASRNAVRSFIVARVINYAILSFDSKSDRLNSRGTSKRVP